MAKTGTCYICKEILTDPPVGVEDVSGVKRSLCYQCFSQIDFGKNPAATPQPMPEGQGQEVLEEVIKDLRDRSREGIRKYGTTLRVNNGRDALMDAYQEALDLCQYLKQAIMERVKNE